MTSLKIAQASPNPDAAKFKYLDDRYTETATKCYNMKLEVSSADVTLMSLFGHVVSLLHLYDTALLHVACYAITS